MGTPPPTSELQQSQPQALHYALANAQQVQIHQIGEDGQVQVVRIFLPLCRGSVGGDQGKAVAFVRWVPVGTAQRGGRPVWVLCSESWATQRLSSPLHPMSRQWEAHTSEIAQEWNFGGGTGVLVLLVHWAVGLF